MKKARIQKEKMYYEPPYMEVVEVELEQIIAGTIPQQSGTASDTWEEGNSFQTDGGGAVDSPSGNNDIEWW